MHSLVPQNIKSGMEFIHGFQSVLRGYFSDMHRFWVNSISFHSENEVEIVVSICGAEAFGMCKRQELRINEIFKRESFAYFGFEKSLKIIEGGTSPNVCIPFVRPVENISSEVNPKYNFESFIVSSENKVAHSIATKFADAIIANKHDVSKLFICGNIGNGKTHLMQSIANHVAKSKKVLYLGAEKFMFLYTTAVRENTILEFRKHFYNTNVLLIDDVHFIASKKGTMEELETSIRAITSAGGFVCMTGATHPVKTNGCVVATIEDPSLSLRYEILKNKAQRLGYNIAENVLKTLAERINSNVRELEGALSQIIMHSTILDSPIDEYSAQFILKEIFTQNAFKRVSIKTVIESTCAFYGITKEDLLARSRAKNLARARKVGIYLAREMTNETICKIGMEFGGRTRDAVMKTIKSMDGGLHSDEILALKNKILAL